MTGIADTNIGRVCLTLEMTFEGCTENWANQTIWTGDNLPIMRGMNSDSVDLIYLDPPFKSDANYAAPIGSQAAGAEFKDTWTLNDIDIAWLDLIEVKHPALNRVIHAAMSNSDKSYLIYMAARLLEMRRLLKPTGSIYLHCDPTMSHYLKLAMDAVFGRRNFRNEIVWHYYNGTSNIKRAWARKHDVLLFYAKDEKAMGFHEDQAREPYEKNSNFANNPESYGAKYRPHPLGKRSHDVWRIPTINNMARERTGYPTQKPLALLHRIIKASSKPDDVVFDPFCGCATTCVAAEIEQRQWAGIDIGSKAFDLVKARLDREIGLTTVRTCINRTDMPKRTDLGTIKRYNHPDNRKQLYGDQGGHCNGCGEHFKPQNLTVDHIIPTSKGGTDHLGNLQLLCGHCNSVKGDRGHEYLIERLAA